MNQNEFKARTRAFALRVLKLADTLPASVSGRTIAKQIARSGTSVAANYRSACRARSKADFIAKMAIVEEEADETLFWLELATDAALVPPKKLQSLTQETEELLKLTVASIVTARGAHSIRNPQSMHRPESAVDASTAIRNSP